jgi:arsenical pump membrane protein
MWLVSLTSAIILYSVSLVYALVKRRRPSELIGCTKRAPFVLVPFVLSMFIIVLALKQNGFIALAADTLGADHALLKYGVSSFLVSDITNNIPMSVLFSPIVNSAPQTARLGAAYGTVVGSNIGAFLTPVGALAGIMWMSLLKRYRQNRGKRRNRKKRQRQIQKYRKKCLRRRSNP